MMTIVAVLLGALVIGSIPTSYFVARMSGIDLCYKNGEVGPWNAYVWRSLAWYYRGVLLALDFIKIFSVITLSGCVFGLASYWSVAAVGLYGVGLLASSMALEYYVRHNVQCK